MYDVLIKNLELDAREDAERSQTDDRNDGVECSAGCHALVDHGAYMRNIHVLNSFQWVP